MKRNKNGTFTSEGLKGNRFAEGQPANATSYKGGHTPHNSVGINKPRILNHKRDGKQVITTLSETKTAVTRGKVYTTKKRTSYARVVVGLENIPYGYIVWHVDRNPLNNDRANLEVISRGEMMRRNSNGR